MKGGQGEETLFPKGIPLGVRNRRGQERTGEVGKRNMALLQVRRDN